MGLNFCFLKNQVIIVMQMIMRMKMKKSHSQARKKDFILKKSIFSLEKNEEKGFQIDALIAL